MKELKKDRIDRLIRVPAGLYGELRDRAESEERSINAQIIVAIREHLDRDKAPV